MRLTVYTDYSLRMLMYLAVKSDGLATIAEVAVAYGISKAHLTKVAHQLGLAGFVETVRGKGGGLRLARPPTAIGLGDVVRHTEPDMALVPLLWAGARALPDCAGLRPTRRALRGPTGVPSRARPLQHRRPRATARGLEHFVARGIGRGSGGVGPPREKPLRLVA